MLLEGEARILVVDDEPNVLETIAAILSLEGYAVSSAGGVEEALAALDAAPFDLVLTDLRMEGASGLSLIGELAQRWPDTMVIMLTGYASLESAIDAMRKGAYDYLIKPCNVEELKATVARAIERGALARALRERLVELDAANAKLQSFSAELQRRVDEATAELNLRVAELAEANARLERVHEQREQFVSMVAHELGQPLSSIMGFAQLLGRPKLSETARERALTGIVTETRRLSRLVRDLADVSRLSSGRFSVHPVECDLVEIVRDQVEQAQIATDKHSIQVAIGPEAVRTLCDRDRVAQVLSNLLGNAIKYTPGGDVRVRLDVEDSVAVISVSDDGPGIPCDRLEAIFEPHVQLARDEAGEPANGAGLGLYIARGIVEAHGGRIWAESAVGQGATFTLRLPLGNLEAMAEEAAQPKEERVGL